MRSTVLLVHVQCNYSMNFYSNALFTSFFGYNVMFCLQGDADSENFSTILKAVTKSKKVRAPEGQLVLRGYTWSIVLLAVCTVYMYLYSGSVQSSFQRTVSHSHAVIHTG